ncbi:MAG TPA: biopolymer transporter ExbD [Lacipirellulaceae bacterium]
MQTSMLGLSDSAFDQFIPRKPQEETPEFDITAMVDLVFMMNIYFLVTYVTVALGEISLPTASHVSALDADSATIVTVMRSPDGRSIEVYLGDGTKSTPIGDPAEQKRRVQQAVEQGVAGGKTDVLLKAERKVRLGDLFRIATAAGVEGVKLHVAVTEKDGSQ